MPKRKMTLDPELAAEAKSIVVLAFRNGPIRRYSRWQGLSYLFSKVRILPHNANRNEEDHEEGGGHGLQVALAETERSREDDEQAITTYRRSRVTKSEQQ
jgi:hypothetical protein